MNHEVIAPNPWMILPFALLLGAMALAPLLADGWWSRHYAKVSLALGAIALGYYLLGLQASARVWHMAHDYTSFIALVGSLFVVSGGIHINVKGEATPLGNVVFLFIGAVVANVLGTTGAAMLLIRPWIRMNRYRVTAHHIAFFIFIVANVGGCLTPIGDPPLFLGYLQGCRFGGWQKIAGRCGRWASEFCWRCFTSWTGSISPRAMRSARAGNRHETWRFDGLPNLFFLAVILGAVFVTRPVLVREALMVAAAIGSYFTTPKPVHVGESFQFSSDPGSCHFVRRNFCDDDACARLAQSQRPLSCSADQPAPGIFFWGTGILSGMLDNAPTYLGCLNALSGATGARSIGELLNQHALSLLAISVGAVFFGAATYIGNGPNFMVKAVADQQKIRLPTFSGFVLKFTLPFLLPMWLAIWLIFFRG